ncbi:hypothetical protein SAMN05444340_12923 [Citreimonas salinaria]|uniref:Uncharacterized protein n=1 Tax=Citreimonas salinaria TaxID=321339 RepID=A0A1H3NTV2_9RHOB|nr:hypothetical protein SAMN05444340_12923 [Citreimonas salinaria]
MRRMMISMPVMHKGIMKADAGVAFARRIMRLHDSCLGLAVPPAAIRTWINRVNDRHRPVRGIKFRLDQAPFSG